MTSSPNQSEKRRAVSDEALEAMAAAAMRHAGELFPVTDEEIEAFEKAHPQLEPLPEDLRSPDAALRPSGSASPQGANVIPFPREKNSGESPPLKHAAGFYRSGEELSREVQEAIERDLDAAVEEEDDGEESEDTPSDQRR